MTSVINMAPPSLYLTYTTFGLIFILLGPEVTDSVQIIRCHSGAFYNPQLRACQICRKCPKDEIIKKPCSTLTDTKCGPFKGFNKSDFEHVQRQDYPPGGAPSSVVPAGPEGGSGGATRDYRKVSWKNITLISVGFFMTFTALVAIIIIIVRIFYNRKHYRAIQYIADAPNLVIVKTIAGVEQRSILALVSPLVKPREESNPLYDVTNSDELVTSQRPLFPPKAYLCDTDRDSDIGQ